MCSTTIRITSDTIKSDASRQSLSEDETVFQKFDRPHPDGVRVRLQGLQPTTKRNGDGCVSARWREAPRPRNPKSLLIRTRPATAKQPSGFSMATRCASSDVDKRGDSTPPGLRRCASAARPGRSLGLNPTAGRDHLCTGPAAATPCCGDSSRVPWGWPFRLGENPSVIERWRNGAEHWECSPHREDRQEHSDEPVAPLGTRRPPGAIER